MVDFSSKAKLLKAEYTYLYRIGIRKEELTWLFAPLVWPELFPGQKHKAQVLGLS
jgi:hypothetical protein